MTVESPVDRLQEGPCGVEELELDVEAYLMHIGAQAKPVLAAAVFSTGRTK